MKHQTHQSKIFLGIFLFLIVWLVTFNLAYVNGDDVGHMVKAIELKRTFFPQFRHSWTPNRVFDEYFRALCIATFDLIYFPLHTLCGVGFFNFYKFFNATLFAGFITFVYGYIIRFIEWLAKDPSSKKNNPTYLFSIYLLLAIILITVLPWKNQVQFVCYQVPAFLCFVLFCQLNKMTVHSFKVINEARQGKFYMNPPWLMTSDRFPMGILLLAFVCAFSLEAYAATILLALSILWLAIFLLFPLRNTHPFAQFNIKTHKLASLFLVISWTMLWCAVALYIARNFSDRVANSLAPHIGDNLKTLISFLFEKNKAGVYCLVVAAALILVGFVYRKRHLKLIQKYNFKRSIFYFIAIIVMLTNVFITIFVSAAANKLTAVNYLSSVYYPWGGILLIAKFYCMTLLCFILYQSPREKIIMNNIIFFCIFIIASKYLLSFFDAAYEGYQRSALVEKAYHTALESNKKLIDSGLNLAHIAEQERPLPTQQSASWMISDYEKFFQKYYGATKKIPQFR